MQGLSLRITIRSSTVVHNSIITISSCFVAGYSSDSHISGGGDDAETRCSIAKAAKQTAAVRRRRCRLLIADGCHFGHYCYWRRRHLRVLAAKSASVADEASSVNNCGDSNRRLPTKPTVPVPSLTRVE